MSLIHVGKPLGSHFRSHGMTAFYSTHLGVGWPGGLFTMLSTASLHELVVRVPPGPVPQVFISPFSLSSSA